MGDLRRDLRAGEAYDEGKTRRDGRTVERIRLGSRTDAHPLYFYVDPDTFYPVEIAFPDPGEAHSIRFAAFEYLPRTAANLALTNIRAQHPHATGP